MKIYTLVTNDFVIILLFYIVKYSFCTKLKISKCIFYAFWKYKCSKALQLKIKLRFCEYMFFEYYVYLIYTFTKQKRWRLLLISNNKLVFTQQDFLWTTKKKKLRKKKYVV